MNQLTKTIVENGITYVLGGNYSICRNTKDMNISNCCYRELDTYLYQLNEECYEYLQKLVERMKESAGITLMMKQTNFMRCMASYLSDTQMQLIQLQKGGRFKSLC